MKYLSSLSRLILLALIGILYVGCPQNLQTLEFEGTSKSADKLEIKPIDDQVIVTFEAVSLDNNRREFDVNLIIRVFAPADVDYLTFNTGAIEVISDSRKIRYQKDDIFNPVTRYEYEEFGFSRRKDEILRTSYSFSVSISKRGDNVLRIVCNNFMSYKSESVYIDTVFATIPDVKFRK